MNQKLTRSLFLLIVLFSINSQSNAQVEVKLNPPLALFGVFQLGIEFPFKNEFGFETEIVFLSIEENFGAGLITHGKYYFNPNFGSDKIYIGFFAGGFAGSGNKLVGFGIEAGYKLIGKRNIVLEIGGGIGRGATEEGSSGFPYGRLLIGYRFPKKEKR